MPTSSILGLPDDVLDQIGTLRLPDDLTVSLSKLAVTYPAGMTLDRSQQLAIRIIADASAERPIYFSSSAGLMRQIGLDPWGVRHGLTTRLELRSLDEDPPEGLVRGSAAYGSDWYDVEHSMRLYDEVYRFRGLRDREIWQDRSTLMIPWQYYFLALQLSDVVAVDGRDAAITRRLEDDAQEFQLLAQGGVRGQPLPESVR
jgi:hypothetical protein